MSVRLKSGRSPVRSRPWPPKFVQLNDPFMLPELIAKLANWLYAYTLSDDAQRLQKLVRVTTAPR
jgi:hypothetical protein